MELLVIFRDKILGVPSIALLLDFFSVKEAVECFLYISKRSSAKLIISDLPLRTSSERNVIFLLVAVIGSTIPLIERTPLAFLLSEVPPENLRELSFVLIFLVFRGHRIIF